MNGAESHKGVLVVPWITPVQKTADPFEDDEPGQPENHGRDPEGPSGSSQFQFANHEYIWFHQIDIVKPEPYRLNELT